MKNWPWWAWLSIGAIGGLVAALVAIRGSDALGSPAFEEAVAWQGWVGGAIGAAAATGVALAVMRRSLRADQARFEQQRKDAQEHLDRQLVAAQRNSDKAMRQAARDARDAARNARRLAIEQSRIDAWAAFVSDVREYFWFPVDHDELAALEQRVTASYFRWTLYMGADDKLVIAGVMEVLSRILGTARNDAERQRETNATTPEEVHAWMIRCSADDLIAELVEFGSDLHRQGDAAEQAFAWAEELGRNSPFLSQVTPRPPLR